MDLLTTIEVADRLGVSQQRIRQFADEKRLKPVRLGDRLYFKPKDVERFEQTKRRPGGRPKTIKA